MLSLNPDDSTCEYLLQHETNVSRVFPSVTSKLPSCCVRRAVVAILFLPAFILGVTLLSCMDYRAAVPSVAMTELEAISSRSIEVPVQSEWPDGVNNVWLNPSQADVDLLYERMHQVRSLRPTGQL